MTISLLVLANSKKSGGRCLAGLNLATGEWIRPVTAQRIGEIPTQLTVRDDAQSQLRPLDVISLELLEKQQMPHQDENFRFVETSLGFSHASDLQDHIPILRSKCQAIPWFLEAPEKTVEPAYYEKGDANRESLALLELTDLVIHETDWGSRRISFVFNSISWELPMTDDYFPQETVEIPHAFICLSVGEPYARPGSDSLLHYKLVAGVIPIS